MTAEEQELVMILISAVRQEIEARLAEQGVEVPSAVRVEVLNVLGWVYQSAEIRAAKNGG